MKLQAILKEVTANRDREMVTGVAEILRQVKDETNREQIASNMMRQFDQEGVEYDQLEFLKMANVHHIQPINTVQSNAHHKVTADQTDVRRIAAELTNR